ncbi:hypothetical protein Golob_019686 [Gossypium lobatum]|uniref:Uncharacterized protein n=1 Tax=Gossypium lobatum TaxID=34289 RepID=A0A7J8L837_9ROSI|nr:hypothetical protein [Gossypium lobatum]
MEDGLANLKIQDGEEEKPVEEEVQQEFCLMRCFLTALVANGEQGPDGGAIDLFFFLGSSSRFVTEDDVEGSAKQFGDFIGSFIECDTK